MPTRSLTSSDSAAATCQGVSVMAGLCRISPATLSDHGWCQWHVPQVLPVQGREDGCCT